MYTISRIIRRTSTHNVEVKKNERTLRTRMSAGDLEDVDDYCNLNDD